MEQQRDNFLKLYARLTADPRITPLHISLAVALLYHWQQAGRQNPFPVSRKKLRQLARFKSNMTYHKIISQLQEFGYIDYQPSYHPRQGSRVKILF